MSDTNENELPVWDDPLPWATDEFAEAAAPAAPVEEPHAATPPAALPATHSAPLPATHPAPLPATSPAPALSPPSIETSANEENFEDFDLGESYGTFFVGKAEFGLPATRIREVVPYPEAVTPVPLSRDAVHGIFSLRGELIPIVDLGSLLGIAPEVERSESRVAVIEDGIHSLGVALDRTGEVLQPTPETIHQLEHTDDAGQEVIDGVIQRRDEGRFIQTLSPALLGLVSGAPQTSEEERAARLAANLPTYSKAIIVRVGSTELAFRIEDVLEIQGELNVNSAPAYFEHCAGVVMLRERSLPILDLRKALGADESSSPRNYVFVKHEGSSIGLAVDGLVETREFPDTCILPIPELLMSTMTDICRNVVAIDTERNVLMVDIEHLYGHFKVTDTRKILGASESEATGDDNSNHEVRGFFTFRAGDVVLCVHLERVLEVQELNSGQISVGHDQSSTLFQLRGQVVPLIRLRNLLGLEESSESEIALILEYGDSRFGLVVDSVEDIKRAPESGIAECNLDIYHASLGKVAQFIESGLLAETSPGNSEVLLVLDIESLIQKN